MFHTLDPVYVLYFVRVLKFCSEAELYFPVPLTRT
jgi:hypothetical protein